MTVRVAIADDEPLARATLRGLLADDPDVELVAECKNGNEAVDAVREHAPDLVFLDVQMPGRDGFAVLDELGEDVAPRVVFVTAYDRYALRAFDVHAVDYLLKPFTDERFRQALERAKAELGREGGSGMGPQVAEMLSAREAAAEGDGDGGEPGGPLERLSIHREGRIELVDVAAIEWIEAADQYVQVHADDGSHLMRESMSRLERRLDPARFLRVHRSAIVAVDRVRSLESTGSGTGRLLLQSGAEVPVSRARAPRVRERLR